MQAHIAASYALFKVIYFQLGFIILRLMQNYSKIERLKRDFVNLI